MRWLLLCLHLLLFLHFPSFSSSSSSFFNFSCHPEESSALLQFKSSFRFTDYSYGNSGGTCDKWPKTATWENGTDCCSWPGVKCDAISGHVIGLNLGCDGLVGVIHPNSTLFHLAHLQSLNLSHNNFSQSRLHSQFGGFVSLAHLDLSDSYFAGEIPPQISHLSKLASLHLSGNYELVWKETTFKRLIQNTTNLRDLFLDEANMSSIRPNSMFSLLNQSSSLVTLSLQETSLRGNLKHNILCLPGGIQELYMSGGNIFRGQLPELSCSASLTILDLSGSQLQGPIPPSFSNLTHLTSLDLSQNYQLNASIPSSLLTLPRLTFLYLFDNELSGQIPNVFHQSNRFQEIYLRGNKIGGELPSSLSNLQHLTHLDLSYNSFSGQIPDVFGGLTKLQELRLLANNLEGQIPSSLFNLTQLSKLDCFDNNLEGPLPNKITGFQNLTSLILSYNLLDGTIPSWCLSLPSLVDLHLSNNQFTGHISAVSSYSLEYLSLCNNKLQGNIPESIFNLANLTELCLSSNNLSGVVNFQLFSKLQNLRLLSLSQNSQLSLDFESNKGNYSSFTQLTLLELSSVSLTEFPRLSAASLYYLDLSNNKLNGRVPNWLLEMDSLVFLNLSQNLFTSIDKFPWNLGVLDLSFNFLAGDISLSICNTRSLAMLNLAHNKLTGTIPQCLANLSSLEVLDLHMNKLHGTLPNIFSKGSKLQTLNLNGNQLEGLLPKSLSNCTYLEVLNLDNNHIEDTFPHWLQTLQYLEVLVLRGNKLHGPIAPGKIKHPFPSLIIFDISHNNFSGSLPNAYIKEFEAMKNVTKVKRGGSLGYMKKYVLLGEVLRYIDFIALRIKAIDVNRDLQYMGQMIATIGNSDDSGIFYDSVTMTIKGIEIPLVKILADFVIIDLSNNNFEGEISDAIGELHDLKGLNLSHNRLTGPIPQSLGNLTNLESLDLSSNMLTGGIPAELTNLNFLEVLNLSYNNLIGEIPQGKQFNTFLNDSYKGNLGLCGLPLPRKCRPEQHSPPSPSPMFWSEEEKFGFGWKPVAIGYGCGMVFGVGLGCCVLKIGKPRWLVIIFGGQPNRRRVKRRTRMMRRRSGTMNQLVQMS